MLVPNTFVLVTSIASSHLDAYTSDHIPPYTRSAIHACVQPSIHPSSHRFAHAYTYPSMRTCLHQTMLPHCWILYSSSCATITSLLTAIQRTVAKPTCRTWLSSARCSRAFTLAKAPWQRRLAKRCVRRYGEGVQGLQPRAWTAALLFTWSTWL